MRHRTLGATLLLLPLLSLPSPADDHRGPSVRGEPLPTGMSITPTAAPGSVFTQLDPGIATRPGFTVDHAVSAALSPDATTLLVLTSGYNLFNGPDGNPIPQASTEYVFVFDVTRVPAVQRQVVQVPNTFSGIAWAPSGDAFYVSGGVNDNLHVFARNEASFAESGSPISLGHKANPPFSAGGLGLAVSPEAAGVAVTADGTRAVVANFENDSASVVDLVGRKLVAEVQLRPGKIDPAKSGTPGGEFPYWVAVKGNSKAYVTSQRDGEVVIVDLGGTPRVAGRIAVGAQPNKMILDRAQRRLFVANGNSDTVSVIDTATDRVLEEIPTTAPRELFAGAAKLKGSSPNSLALSPDERTLYVTNGGTNALAVIRLRGGEAGGDDEGDDDDTGSAVIGLIPTGWYPTAVATTGARLFVVNAKSNAGPNPKGCRDTVSIAPGADVPCNAANSYVWQTEKAGLLQLPAPGPAELMRLTLQVAVNDRFPAVTGDAEERELMELLRGRIHHVVYIVKENRTYDQVLGDLRPGNGDRSLVLFPEAISPNHHALARGFVTLDNFYDSGETSGVGWNWTTAGRTTDVIEKTQPVNYSGRGLTYDWEGTNRNINVGLATTAQRQAVNPISPPDPDLLPGAIDVSSAVNADGVETYLWTNALRHGLTVRNYGFWGDLTRYGLPPGPPLFGVPPDRDAFAHGNGQFFPAGKDLQAVSDPFFRGFDMRLADFWRFKEWEREFDQFARNGNLPSLTLLRLPHDHFGSFSAAMDGVNTPETQMADNDYAIGLVVEKISHRRFAGDTLIFIVEDDAQDGPDHVDAHRSLAYVLGANVRRGALVSQRYDTVSMVRTIEDVLGLPPQGLTDGLAAPMSRVFQRESSPWAYTAKVPAVLRTTSLPLPPDSSAESAAVARPRRSAAWWARATAGQDFSREDALDTARFNRALWRGIKGDRVAYPVRQEEAAAVGGTP
jgi:YVTN family beta-propeller protein